MANNFKWARTVLLQEVSVLYVKGTLDYAVDH